MTKEILKVIYLKYFIVFTHLNINVENTIMINHLNSIKCVKIFTNKNLKWIAKNLNYQALIKKLGCEYWYLFFYYMYLIYLLHISHSHKRLADCEI